MKRMNVFAIAMLMAVSIFANAAAIGAEAHNLCDLSSIGSLGSSTGDTGSKKSDSKKPGTEKSGFKASKAIESIKSVCGLKSKVETDVSACIVDVGSKVNPYDVVYDYGENYNAYIAACDWSLVFDADYYIEQFPLLAMQYHNDKKLLLKHFQTVGIQEGRQGSAKFNVGVYRNNCAKSVSKAFGSEYEGYYFYYMLNYSSEKSVKAVSENAEPQQAIVMTALQAQEFKAINNYRAEVRSQALVYNSELAAFANYRAWVNVHEGYNGHDWMDTAAGDDIIRNTVASEFGISCYDENMCEWDCAKSYGETHSVCYRNSAPHYRALINARYDIYGISNSYASKSSKLTAQFDLFGDL